MGKSLLTEFEAEEGRVRRNVDSPRAPEASEERDQEDGQVSNFLFDTPSGVLIIAAVAFLALVYGITAQNWFWAVVGAVFLLIAGYRFRKGDFGAT
jgi:uncharacterized ion transporter superfamily protein YfcC